MKKVFKESVLRRIAVLLVFSLVFASCFAPALTGLAADHSVKAEEMMIGAGQTNLVHVSKNGQNSKVTVSVTGTAKKYVTVKYGNTALVKNGKTKSAGKKQVVAKKNKFSLDVVAGKKAAGKSYKLKVIFWKGGKKLATRTTSSIQVKKISEVPDRFEADQSENGTPEPEETSEPDISRPKPEETPESTEVPVAGTETPAGKKVLIAYFSQTGEQYGVGVISKGNTEIIAEMIAGETSGDLFHIERTEPYPTVYDELKEVAKTEQTAKKRPALTASVSNWAEYDTIYLGYPIWWGDLPMPVYTFMESYDWTGKTVIPFCTHAGSGLSGTVSSIANETRVTPKAGLAIAGTEAQNNPAGAKAKVLEWLKH